MPKKYPRNSYTGHKDPNSKFTWAEGCSLPHQQSSSHDSQKQIKHKTQQEKSTKTIITLMDTPPQCKPAHCSPNYLFQASTPWWYPRAIVLLAPLHQWWEQGLQPWCWPFPWATLAVLGFEGDGISTTTTTTVWPNAERTSSVSCRFLPNRNCPMAMSYNFCHQQVIGCKCIKVTDIVTGLGDGSIIHKTFNFTKQCHQYVIIRLLGLNKSIRIFLTVLIIRSQTPPWC